MSTYLIKPKTNKAVSVIIPAAGEGKRSKSYGTKSLFEVKPNLTLIEHQINSLRAAFGKCQIILVTGFESDRLMNFCKDFGICQVENERFNETNIVRSISMGLRVAMNPNLFIMYGDIYCETECLKHNYVKSTIFFKENEKRDPNRIGCTFDERTKNVENLFFDLPNEWCQMAYIHDGDAKAYRNYCLQKTKGSNFEYEALNYLINKGHEFQAKFIHKNKKCFDIDMIQDLEKINDSNMQAK